MTAAVITRLVSGAAVLDVGGVPVSCKDWRAAAAEADSLGIPWQLAGPNRVVVLAERRR